MAEEELYCTCQQPADDRFMIACDKCEEWYHGECIGVLESESTNIKYYYCGKCRSQDPSLKTKYRKRKEKKHDKEKKKDRKSSSYLPDKRESKKAKRRVKIYSDDEDSFEGFMDKGGSRSRKGDRSARKSPVNPVDVFGDAGPETEDDDDLKFEAFMSSEKKTKKEVLIEPPLAQTQYIPDVHVESMDVEKKLPKRRRESNRESLEQPNCIGPRCVLPARKKSKYCSDQCGRNLASLRIQFLLPKIEDMKKHPSVATIEQYYRLETLKLKYQTILELRDDLETKFIRLEEVITIAKQKSITPPESDDEPSSEDPMIFCFVCGHLRPSKTLIDHIDKCYRRVEAETSYGSIYETKVEGSQRLFCDTYNNNTKAFCKRLKVMCAEHSKDSKPEENEVCGCPLNPDNFYDEEINDILTCRVAKKLCRKHLLWEKMYRAEIDLKRIRVLIKLDQNLEERKKLEHGINNRLGAALLLLNNTIRHADDYDLRPEERKIQTKVIEERLANNCEGLLDVVGLSSQPLTQGGVKTSS